jgi:hypothetical protein
MRGKPKNKNRLMARQTNANHGVEGFFFVTFLPLGETASDAGD